MWHTDSGKWLLACTAHHAIVSQQEQSQYFLTYTQNECFHFFLCFVNQHYRNKRSIWILLSSTLLVSYISKEHIDSLLKLKKCSLGNATFGQNAGALSVSLLFLDSAFVLLDINPGQPVWNSVACYWLHTDLSIWNHECDVWKAKNIPCAL